MTNISTELKVGAAVLIATVILMAAILWVKDYRIGASRYAVSVLFPNVGNLEPGDQVKVMGVKKGRVTQVEIAGDQVLVTFTLANDVALRQDARFRIMNIGLMGERFIGVEPGETAERFNLSVPGRGEYDNGLPEIMSLTTGVIEKFNRILVSFDSSFGGPSAASSMRQIVGNMEKITSDWKTLTEENKERMTQALQDLAGSSSQIKEILNNNRAKFESTLDNINQGSEKFLDLTSRLDSLSGTAHTLMAGLSDGHGSFGRAFRSDSLYDELYSISIALDSLIADFKLNPKKYVKLTIF